MILEIRVADTCQVVDTIPQAVAWIEHIIREYFISNSVEPITITLRKVEATGPPVLSVTVGDTQVSKETLS